MKVRKLAVALALAGGLGSGVAQALGLGEIDLQSYLNEPLDADIELRKSAGVSPNEVFVNLAPESAYNRVGIDRSYFLTKLNFQVTTAPDGNLVVNVSSREPLREPYLNFLVEVTWPNGRLMREYAVLVDPPVYAEDSGVQEQVATPTATQQSRQSQQQAAPAQQRQTVQRTTQSRTSGARTLGPTNSADTLWTIAAQVRPNDSVSMQQVMLAIQDLNPNAFIDGNINRLKRGEILRIPDENQIRSRTRAEANQQVAIQNRAFETPARTVDASGSTAPSGSGSDAGSSGGDQLRLVAADDSASRDAEDGGSAGGDGDTAGGVDAGAAVAMEELESTRRENEELTGRVDDLQDQVQTLQRLLELKNSQLAEMQGAQAEEQPLDGAAPSDEAPADAEEPSGDMAEDTAGADPEAMSEDAEGVTSDEAMPEEVAEEGAESMSADDEVGMAQSSDGEASEAPEAASDDTTESIGESDDGMASEEPMPADQAPEEQAEPVAETEEAPTEPASQATETAPAEKPFPGNIIDAITNNFIYQVALGGGLVVLLLLLLLLARRNANREKAFYDQLNGESDGEEGDSFDLTFDDEEQEGASEDDPIAEADAYIAYGRNDQAAQTLETAISREPSRSDLRLKLLGVYADIQDRESFDKQFREIEALDDEDATAEAQSIQARLEEAEAMPSIDDLESQLRSGGSEPVDETSVDDQRDSYESDEMESDFETALSEYDKEDESSSAEQADASLEEPDFEDMDLDLPEESEESLDFLEEPESSQDSRDDLIEYDLSGLESDDDTVEESDDGVQSKDDDTSFDYSLEEGELEQVEDDDLSLDLESSELESTDGEEPVADQDQATTDLSDATDLSEEWDESSDSVQSDELDESFLDELDAELDKVANEDETATAEGESELDDLELDVSDEDLALMEEFSENDAEADKPSTEPEEEPSLEDELGLEDALQGDEPVDPEQEVEGAEQVAEESADTSGDSDEDDASVPVASDSASSAGSEKDLDEADLGDDDDFDFLAGTDEAATKLDLARAYVEMGDVDGARDILEEVALEGNDEQKAEAQDLLKNLS